MYQHRMINELRIGMINYYSFFTQDHYAGFPYFSLHTAYNLISYCNLSQNVTDIETFNQFDNLHQFLIIVKR